MGDDWSESGEGNSEKEDDAQDIESISYWHEFRDDVVEGELCGSCETDEYIPANQMIHVWCCCANDTPDGCHCGGTYKEPAAAKDIRETPDKGIANSQTQCPCE